MLITPRSRVPSGAVVQGLVAEDDHHLVTMSPTYHGRFLPCKIRIYIPRLVRSLLHDKAGHFCHFSIPSSYSQLDLTPHLGSGTAFSFSKSLKRIYDVGAWLDGTWLWQV